MTKTISKLTLSVAASAVLVSSAFALDPAVTNFGYIQDGDIGKITIFDASDPTKQKTMSSDSHGMVAISPTGNSFYYSGDSGNIVKYNAYTGATTATLTGLGRWNTSSVFSSDGKKLYINGAWEDTSVSGCTPGWDCPSYVKVTVIDTATNNTIQTIQTTADGWGTGIAVSKDGTKIYLASDTMFTIDASTGNTISSVGHGGGGLIDMVGFSLNSTGTKAYTLTGIIDLSTNAFAAYAKPASVNGYYAEHMTLNSDGTKAYVVYNDGYGVANNTKIIIYDASTGLDIGSISPGFVDPHISLSPDGSKLFVFDSRSNTLKVIDTTTFGVQQYTMATKYNFYSLESNISPNLITGTLDTSSSADMTTKGFTNYVNFAGGTLRATGSFTLSNPIYLHDAFNLTYDDSSTFTTLAGGTVDTNGYDVAFSGEVSGVGGLTKAGDGVLTLSGTNTYSGGTTITGGLINFADGANLGTANITLNGGGLQWASGNVTDISVRLEAIGAGGATFDTNGNDVTLASVLSGTGGVTKTGTGVLTLSGTNTYSGGTTITGGLINFAAANNFGSGNITLNGGGLQWASGSTVDISAKLEALGASGATFDTNGNDVTLVSVLSGTGGLTKTGAGVLTLSGTNTYSGATTVNAGTLSFDGGGAIIDTGVVSVASGATLNITTAETVGSVAGAGDITLGADLTTGGANTDNTLSGIISGTGALNKNGTGTLTLSGTNTYSGATTLNAGTLDVTGAAQSSAFSVNSGATLSGSGSVGSLHVANGATLSPTGTSTLNVTGDLTIDTGSTVAINAYANGTNSKVVASGDATINGGAVNITAGAGSWNNSTVYTILSANALSGTFTSVTDNLAFLDPTLSYESNAVKLTLTRNDVSYADVVVVPAPAPTPIPEPVVTPEPIPEPTPTPAPEPVITPEPVPTPKFSYLTVAQTNSMQVARVLDNALASANQDMQQLYTSLNSMSAAQARDAIAQLNGTTIGSIANTSPSQSRTFTLSLNNRMSTMGGGSGIGLASLAFADNADLAQTFRHLADAGAIGENGFIEPQKIGDNEVWVRAVGGKTTTNADSSRNINKSSSTTGGVQTGIDKRSGEWMFGGSFGYLSSDISQTAMDGKINSYQLGFYTAKDTKEYRISLNTVGGKYKNETSRLTPTGMASADFDGLAFSAEIKTTYKIPLESKWSIEPSIGGWVQHYAQDSYSENGAVGSNLAIDKATFTTQALTTELKLIHLFKDNMEYKGSFEIGMGYTKEFGDISAPLVGRFSAAPTAGSFSITAADRGDNVLMGLIGADTSLTTNIKLFTLLNASWRKNEESYNAVLGFKLLF